MKVTLRPNFQLYTVNFSTISQVYNFDAASQPPHLTCYSVYIDISSSLKLTKPTVAACRFKVVSLPLPVHFHQSLHNPAPSLFHPTLRVNPETIQRHRVSLMKKVFLVSQQVETMNKKWKHLPANHGL